jgi:RHS repeat-associated protein
MKPLFAYASLGTLALVGLAAATVLPHRVVTEPDAILDLNATSLTTYLPAATSPKQGVQPRFGQRATQIDGALRMGGNFGLAMQGNPFVQGSSTKVKYGNVRLDQGTYEVNDTDLRLASKGISWVIGRTYNARQDNGSGTHVDSAGYQGKNWFQSSNPELKLYDHDSTYSTDEAEDVLYLVYGADRFVEFKRIGASKVEFRGVNGAAGVVKHNKDSGSEPGTYVYTDQNGNEEYFFDFDGDAGSAQGQLWKIIDPAGNTAYFGDPTTASTAITNGYTSGRPTTAYDATNRRYSYSYDGSSRLTSVVAEILTSGTWTSSPVTANVGQVDYAYYTSDGDTYGDNGDLKTVKVTTPLTDSGVTVVQEKYYRYYDFDSPHTSYNSSTNPGYPHLLQLIVGFEGCRNYDYLDATFDEDFLTETTDNLKPYAEAYFEYDSSYRIKTAFENGQCGCSGGTFGTTYFTYDLSGSYSNDTSGYDEDEWYSRTVVERPDGAYETQYFDEVFQPLSYVLTDADPSNTMPAPSFWATYVDRNSKGVVVEVDTPAVVTAYTHSTASFTRSSSAGLVWTYTLVGSGHTTEGFASDRNFKEAGTSGTSYYDRSWTYDYATYQVNGSELKSQVVRPVVLTDREYTDYHSTSTTNSNLWQYGYSWQDSSGRKLIALKEIDTTQPAVSTGHNGSNSSNMTRKYWNADGTLGWEKSALGYITYHEYTNGLQTKLIEDADTGLTAGGQDFDGITIPTNFSSTGTELHHKITFTYDDEGRLDTRTADSYTPKMYYSKLKDRRLVALGFTNQIVGGGTTYYGPVSYQVRNHAGKSEVSGLIGLTSNNTTAALTSLIDETDDDPITAVDTGTVKKMTTFHYDSSGTQLQESRLYYSIPASEPGTDGTHYDPTTYGYDDLGRRRRTKVPDGTITYLKFDVRGHVTETWTGTNDHDAAFPGGESSGTSDMVKIRAVEYDSGADKGNGYVTTSTDYVQDSTTNQRVTTYTNDARGWRIVEARPTTPHFLHKYDNLGRRIASGMYSSTSGLTSSSDPTATTSSNRRALSESTFDELGRVCETTRHKINQSTGAKEDTLLADTWYDADGRRVKVDGAELGKYFYDRLGRQTHHFVLANDDDAGSYANVGDVSGDTVLEEQQTTYDASDGKKIMEAVIQRYQDDLSTTGALDTNADSDSLEYTAANLKGRIQITAYWNGLQGVSDVVQYGTYGGSNFDRNGLSCPSRTSTALRTSYTYEIDGTVSLTQDPTTSSNHVTKTEFDAAGRKTKEVRHYDSGVNSGNPSGTDDNVTTLWSWSRTPGTPGYTMTVTADMPSGTNDQVTTYTYGVAKGSNPDSRIGCGALLKQTAYPDSSNSNDVVLYAYDAQGAQVYMKTQEPSAGDGNVIEQVYDDSGRPTKEKVTTLGNNFDGAVLRIVNSYNTRGLTSLVTQYDAATNGNVVNEVRFTYDGWGNLTDYEEDKDSAVDAVGSVNDYQVTYAYAKATGGRNTLRRTSMALKYGTGSAIKTFDYTYSSSSSYDDDCSRVTQIKNGAVVLAEYEYLGVGTVVSDNRPDPGIFSKQYDVGSPDAYASLDRFNRPIHNYWTKDLATDKNFFSVDNYWDAAGNVVATQDNVHSGFDVVYTTDGIDRVTEAKEGTVSFPGGVPTINSTTRDQQWTLSHTGNWDREKLDLDGNGNFTGTDEHDDTRTHSDANELATQDLDSTPGTTGDNYTLAYDPTGNMTNDAQSYKYIYDAFNRLRKITDQSNNLVEELKYNGLGHCISEHTDTDADGDVDGSDKWFYKAFDESWRQIATYFESDATPKEIFVCETAGADGYGDSSYVNGVVCRYKDANTTWAATTDGVLEQRYHYCQNSRGDVVALVSASGAMVEWDKYSTYGTPFGLPKGDSNSSGACDSTDATQIQTWINGSAYDVRGDLDLDGDVDTTDKALSLSATLGRMALSSVGNRFGLGGYGRDEVSDHAYHARTRLLDMVLGRWNRRDGFPGGGANLYEYCESSPNACDDPTGEFSIPTPGKAQQQSSTCKLFGCKWAMSINAGAGENVKGILVQELFLAELVCPCPPGTIGNPIEPRPEDGVTITKLSNGCFFVTAHIYEMMPLLSTTGRKGGSGPPSVSIDETLQIGIPDGTYGLAIESGQYSFYAYAGATRRAAKMLAHFMVSDPSSHNTRTDPFIDPVTGTGGTHGDWKTWSSSFPSGLGPPSASESQFHMVACGWFCCWPVKWSGGGCSP